MFEVNKVLFGWFVSLKKTLEVWNVELELYENVRQIWSKYIKFCLVDLSVSNFFWGVQHFILFEYFKPIIGCERFGYSDL